MTTRLTADLIASSRSGQDFVVKEVPRHLARKLADALEDAESENHRLRRRLREADEFQCMAEEVLTADRAAITKLREAAQAVIDEVGTSFLWTGVNAALADLRAVLANNDTGGPE